MRKAWIGAITGALFFAVVGVALALTNNTVQYSAKLTYKGKASKKSPKPTHYEGILHVSTSDGKQPNSAPLSEIFLAKGISTADAKKFPSCKVSDIDGKASVPKKCKKAKVGGGTASSLVGQPGGSGSLRQNLSVTAYNGNKGKQVLLAVTGGPVTNRVIPGDVVGAPAPFSKKIQFRVPKELQGQLGTQISLTDFDVKLFKTKKITKKVHGKKKKVTIGFLEVNKCPPAKVLPTRATVHFNKDDGSPGGPVVSNDSTTACH